MVTNSSRSEKGSVLLWVVGCAAISLLVLTALTQIVASVHHKRVLQHATDAAALAAANQLELTLFRESGNVADISVAQSDARSNIIRRLAELSAPVRIEELIFTAEGVRLRTSQAVSSELVWGLTSRTRVSAVTEVEIAQSP